ncbi:MAG: molybdopterin-dependent oxidoreductase [Armatimonadetes bacterium]|nr:molybdopterin-dependent oxidoreductase [Armatimonadota bacterium]
MRQWFAWRGAIAGVAAGTALAWALVAGWFTGGLPVLAGALSERARGLLPLQVLGYLIVRLKFAAKPFGYWMTIGTVVLTCAVLGGLWAARNPRRYWVVAAGAALVVGAALWLLAAPPAVTYLAAGYGAQGMADAEARALAMRTVTAAVAFDGILAGVVFAVALWLPAGRSQPAASGAPSATVSRREFLSRGMLVAGTLATSGALIHWVGAAAARAGAAAQSLFQRIRGLPPEVTPNDRFYVVSKNPAGLDPKVDASKWSLEITGLVGKPIKLTYEEIRAMPSVTRYHTLECISNEVGGDLVSNALWKGVRFRDLIALAGGVSPKAIRLALRCADGYTEGLPVIEAMHSDTLLAYEMNGERLPHNHGFPVRMLVPGLFGMKNPKWLTKIEAVSTQFTGYWQASGWSDEAVVKTTSQVRVPGHGSATMNAGGEVELGGVAYSGDRGIQEVEFSPDGGKTWIKAETKPPLGKYTWALWAATWKPTGPREYTLKVRARDGTGLLQTSQEAPTLPDGATGYHTIRIRVRK